MKMTKNHGRTILFLVAMLLTVSAVFVLLYPLNSDRQRELIIAGTFMAAAVLCFFSFSLNKRIYFRPGWLLQSAFFMSIFSLILFFLPVIDFELNVTIFAFLAFFMASAQFCASIQLSALEIKRWWWTLIFSIVNLLFGVYFIKLCSVFNISEYPSVCVYMIVIGVIFALEPFIYKTRNNTGGY